MAVIPYEIYKLTTNLKIMKKNNLFTIAILFLSFFIQAQEAPYLYLEEVDGEKALEFVNKQNANTINKLSQEKEYQSIYDKCLDIYNSKERIVYPTIYGDFIYNFWNRSFCKYPCR